MVSSNQLVFAFFEFSLQIVGFAGMFLSTITEVRDNSSTSECRDCGDRRL